MTYINREINLTMDNIGTIISMILLTFQSETVGCVSIDHTHLGINS